MKYPCITSRQNPLVRGAAALCASGDKRREEGRFLLEGARLCEDAVKSGLSVKLCFFTEQAQKKYGDYLSPVLSVCRSAYVVEEHVASLLSSTKSSQGIFCVCDIPGKISWGEPKSFSRAESCVVLENLQDPGNLGTVLRTAEALGIHRVFLLGDCCDPLSPKVLRASMGAVFRLFLCQSKSPKGLQALLKGKGYTLCAAVPSSSGKQVTQLDFSHGLYAVYIGNEGNGLTRETISLCDTSITIPMGGRAESLNASAAATILLWEMKRQTY